MKRHVTKSRRTGGAMLDVVGATLVTAMVMVPSLNIMRRSMAVSSDIEVRQEMVTLCANLMEQEIASTAVSVKPRSTTDVVMLGENQIGQTTTISDAAGSGGIPGELMAVSATVWRDDNQNKRLDNNESRYSLYSKVAIAKKTSGGKPAASAPPVTAAIAKGTSK